MRHHREPRSPVELAAAIKREAHRLGFDLCRVVPVSAAPHVDFFARWIETGRAGEMHYLVRNQEKRAHPARLAEGAETFRSLIVLAVNHHQLDLPPALRDDPSRGIIASYAWGDDYHQVIRPLLHELDAFIRHHTGRTALGKCLVDTGPVLERDWAHRAGLGFTGKNCCTIHPRLGSWLLLATVLVPEELTYDPVLETEGPPADRVLDGLPPAHAYGDWSIPPTAAAAHPGADDLPATCGRCTRCLDACPTDAFVGPFHLDPQRCISYWTIEARGAIPRDLRARFGNRIFGCDICQEVCPYNQRLAERRPLLAALHAHQERLAAPLLEGFQPHLPYWLDQDAFAARFRRSPVKRPKRHGMLRNVCVALGNWAAPGTLPALQQALHDPHPLPRGHAAWALGRLLRIHALDAARVALDERLDVEVDLAVRAEIHAALHDDPAA